MYYDERKNIFDEYDEEENGYISFNINDLNIFNSRLGKDVELMNPVEGLNKGNLFYNLYLPYKNHSYKVKVVGERDGLLLNIQALDFALDDLNLYLDLYPNDKKCLEKFNEYNRKCKEYKRIFEEKYGPLTASGVEYKNNFTWIKNPWPWDKGGSV